ncbi:MAG: FecR domain-containing protein [Vulcanimicrobiaceae bacterium]
MRYRLAVLFLLLAAPAMAKKPPPPPPPVEIALQWKSGTVLFQKTAVSTVREEVTGTHVISADSLVMTGPGSQGVLVYPDSSRVALGGGTTVQVGRFARARDHAASTTIAIPPSGGVVRFDVNHASSGESDFVFTTSLASITVRGTSALLSDGIGGDTLTCLMCEAGDVVARLRGADYAVLTGETLRITPSGRVTIEKTRDDVLATFTATGLSVVLPKPAPTPTPHHFHLPKTRL